MAVDTLLSRGGFFYSIGVPSTIGNFAVDSTTDGIAWAFQPFNTDAITHLGFRYGARTGTPPVQSIALESLSTTGLPDGVDIGGGSPTLVTFTPPADATIDGLWQWKTLTNAYTPARGQILVSTIRYSSGTIDASNNSSYTRSILGLSSAAATAGFPYSLTLNSGTWSKSTSVAVFGYRTANGRFGSIAQSIANTATANTATHKIGMYFTLPSGLGTSYQIRGLSFAGDLGAGSGSCKIGIWSTDGTERQSLTLDSDHLGAAPSPGDTVNPIYFSTANLYDFAYGTKYYCGIEVVSGACGMHGITLAEAADREAYPYGENRGQVAFDGSWTETDTIIPICDLILGDVTLPAAGGGSTVIY